MSNQPVVASGRAIIVPFIPPEAGQDLERQMTAALKPLEEKLRKASVDASATITEPLADPKIEKTFEETGKRSATAFRAAFAASIAVGAILFSEFQKIEQAFNQIRVATGATGAELRSFENSARTVAKNTVASFADVGFAIGDIATRLNLSGSELEAFATTALNLAQITNESVESITRSSTRVLQDWNVAQGQYGDRLNQLFRATQESGIGVTRLNDLLIRNGVALRQLGFSLEESTALLATFEKEGVNTEQTMGALTRVFATFAKNGLTGRSAFDAFVASVKAAPNDINAMTEGIEIAGTRLGPQLVAAIREGKFAFEDMLDAIKNGEDTIDQAALATRTLTDSFGMLKQNLIAAIEPAFRPLFDTVNNLVNLFLKMNKTLQAVIVILTAATIAAKKFNIQLKQLPMHIKNMSLMAKAASGIGIALVAVSLGMDYFQKKADKIAEDTRKSFEGIRKETEQLNESLSLQTELGLTRGLDSFKKEFSETSKSFVKGFSAMKTATEDKGGFWQNLGRDIKVGYDSIFNKEAIKNLTNMNEGFDSIKGALSQLAQEYKQFPKEATELFEDLKIELASAGLSTEQIDGITKDYRETIEKTNEELKETAANEEYRVRVNEEVSKSMVILNEKQSAYQNALKKVEEAQKSLNEEIVITISRLKEFDNLLALSFNPLKGVIDAYRELEDIFQRIDDIQFRSLELFREKTDLRTYDPEYWMKRLKNEEEMLENQKEGLKVERSLVDAALDSQRAERALIDALAQAQRQGIDPRTALEQILGSISGIAPKWVVDELRGKMLPLLDRFSGDVEQLFQDEMIAEINEKERRLSELRNAEEALEQSRIDFVETYEREIDRIIAAVPPKTEAQLMILQNVLSENFETFKDVVGDKWEEFITEAVNVAKREIDRLKNENKIPDILKSTKNPVEEYMDKVMSDNSMVNVPKKSFQEMTDEEKRKYIQDAYMGNTAKAPKYDPFEPKAMGGPVGKNNPYIVGEQGPELFVPNQSGKIIPNHDLMGYNNPITNVFQTRELSATELAQEVEWRQGQQLKGRQR